MFSNINYCEQFHSFALQFSTTRPDEHYGDKFSFSMYIHTTKITILTSFEYIHTHIADIMVRILGPVDLLAYNTPLFNLIKEKRIRACLHGGRKILVPGRSQRADHLRAISFLYSVYMQRVVLVPSAQGHQTDQFLTISVLQRKFCWLGTEVLAVLLGSRVLNLRSRIYEMYQKFLLEVFQRSNLLEIYLRCVRSNRLLSGGSSLCANCAR